MARDGNGTYSLPPGSTVTAGEDIQATQHNTPLNDIVTDLNTARPIVVGGTGATTAASARANLGVAASVGTVDDIATTTVYPQRVVMVRGRDTDGDGGLARYEYATSEPSHAEKKQDPTGAWYELAEREVTIETFGGVSDGSAYVDTEFDRLVAYCVATGATWRHRGTIKLSSTHTIPDTFRAVGYGARSRSATSGNRNRSAIGLDTGYKILVQDPTGEDGTVGDCVFDGIYFYDLETGTAATNRQTYNAEPMLESGRASGWTVKNCHFDGKGFRRYGMWLGKGNTIWASTITQCSAQGCAIGMVIGGTNDATNNVITNNAPAGNIHGMLVYNPRGGIFTGNNPENNDGVGICIVPTSGCSNFAITENYPYNNGQDALFEAEDAGTITVLGNGDELPWTDWSVSGTNTVVGSAVPYNIRIEGNYAIGEGVKYGIMSGAQRGSRIIGNFVQGGSTYDTNDILLTAQAGADTVISANWQQGSTQQNAVTHTNGWRPPLVQNASDYSLVNDLGDVQRIVDAVSYFGEGAFQIGSFSGSKIVLGTEGTSTQKIVSIEAINVDHTGGATTDIFDTATAMPSGTIGMYLVLLTITKTSTVADQQGGFFIVNTAMADASAVTDVSAAILASNQTTNRDSRALTINSGVMQLTGPTSAFVTGVIIALGSRF